MDEQPCQTSNAQHLRVVQQLLWDVISQHLYPAERDEIRRALGQALLSDNETLFAEATAVADILGEVQLNTAALMARHQLCSNPQRAMVETEIRLLIERLHSSATVSPFGSSVVRERDPDSLLPRTGRRDKAVLEYMSTVAQITDAGGRPPSAGLPPRPPTSSSAPSFSRPPTSSHPPTAFSSSITSALPSPSVPGPGLPGAGLSRPSTASSIATSIATRYTDAPSVVASVADKLGVATIADVREQLVAALQDEKVALLDDIEYLQGLLDAEADLQVRAAAPAPSLAELKDYSSRLAAVVQEEESRLEHEVRVSAMFAAAEQQPSRAGRLRGMVDASRRPPSAGDGTSASAATGPGGDLRSSPRSGGSSGGGSVQRLVVHAGEEDNVRQEKWRQVSQRMLSPAAGGELGAPGPESKSPSSKTALRTPSPARVEGAILTAPARPAALAAVRRPGSGGSGDPLPLRPPAPLAPPLARIPSAVATSSSLLSTTTSGAATDASAPGPASGASSQYRTTANGPLLVTSPPSSRGVGHVRTTSPARVLPSGASAGPAGSLDPSPGPAPSPPSTGLRPPHQSTRSPPGTAQLRDVGTPPRSPVLVTSTAATGVVPLTGPLRTGTVTGAPGGGPQPQLAPLRSRSGSTGRSLPLIGHQQLPPQPPAAPPSSGSGSSLSNKSSSGAATARKTPSAVAAAPPALAPAAASPGSTVVARLGGGASEAPQNPSAVQRRVLLGNRQSVVEHLDAEVDAVRGGVAAILERYNLRPGTPSGGPAAPANATATAPAAAGAAKPKV